MTSAGTARIVQVLVLGCLLAWVAFLPRPALAQLPEVPAKGSVTMLDLGAKSCIPCKMMIPVITALEQEYAGKAAILFIDVWQNPAEGKKYGLRAIPTQIFYDKLGKEVFRHEGFFDKQSISEILDRLIAQ